MNPNSERVGLAQMAAAMTLSGTLGVFVLESGQSAWNVVFFRCLFGALSLLAYCWARGLLRPGLYTRRTLALALAAGAALVLNWVLLFSAYRLASISLATAVHNVQPFFLIGLGVLFLGERPSAGKLAGRWWPSPACCWCCDCGTRAPTAATTGRPALGLGAAAVWRHRRHRQAPEGDTAAGAGADAGDAGRRHAAAHGRFQRPARLAAAMELPVALGLVHTCLMYILMYSAIQKLPTTSTAALSFIYPAVAILLDLLVYGHRMDMAQIAGVALIFRPPPASA